MNSRKQLFRYASGIILIAIIAASIFVFWPTAISRPAAPNVPAAYQLLISFDQPFHAIPSLHAAFAIYSALCGIMVSREAGTRKLWPVLLWSWAALILLATLTTKQHLVVDLLSGSALGFAAYVCAFKKHLVIPQINHPVQSVVNSPNSAKL